MISSFQNLYKITPKNDQNVNIYLTCIQPNYFITFIFYIEKKTLSLSILLWSMMENIPKI